MCINCNIQLEEFSQKEYIQTPTSRSKSTPEVMAVPFLGTITIPKSKHYVDM